MENSERDGKADHLTCLLRNLYAGQEAPVRAGHVPGASTGVPTHDKVMWSGIPISFSIFLFIVIHTVKGFGIVNKAETDVFLELLLFP